MSLGVLAPFFKHIAVINCFDFSCSRAVLEAFKELQAISIKSASPTLFTSMITFEYDDNQIIPPVILYIQKHAGMVHDSKSINRLCFSILIDYVLNIQLISETANKRLTETLVTE